MQMTKHKPFKKHDISALKARIDLRDVAEKIIGPPVKRRAKYSTFYAPDRDERTPSLQVWRDGFKDFGSSEKGGDLFVFLERYAGLSFKEVLEQYDPDGGIVVAFDAHKKRRAPVLPNTVPQQHAAEATFIQWQALTHKLATECQKLLQNNLSVQKHLYTLGYTDTTISARGIGYNPEWRKFTLAGSEETFWLPPGIVYPWIVDDQIYAIKVRCPYEKDGKPDALAQLMGMAPQKAKYMHVGGGRGNEAWYGTIANPTWPTIFVEGEKDCDMLFQAIGDQVNVITVGSASGVLPQKLIERLQHVPWIAIVLDNDRAGYENAPRLRQMLTEALADTDVFVVDYHIDIEHKDIADWLNAGGNADTWLKKLEHYVWQKAAERTWRDDINAIVFPRGVPNTLREIILGMHNLSPYGKRFIQDQANAIMVYELIQEALLQQKLSNPFTVKELKAAAEAIGAKPDDSSTRRGLAQLLALGFLSESQPIILSVDQDLGGNSAENSAKQERKGRGRPARTYYVVPLRTAITKLLEHVERRLREALYADVLPANVEASWFVDLLDEEQAVELATQLEQASAELYAIWQNERRAVEHKIRQQMSEWRQKLMLPTLDKQVSTPILYDQFLVTSGRDYRDALYGSMVIAAHNHRQVPRAETARALGVDYKTIGAMRKRLGIVADPSYELFELEGDIEDVCVTADRYADWAAGREYGRYLESSSGECIRLDKDDPQRMNEWLKRQRMAGSQVCLKIQVASIERFATPEELEEQSFDEITERDFSPPPQASSASGQGGNLRQKSPPRTSTKLKTVDVDVVMPSSYSRAFVMSQLALRIERSPYLAQSASVEQLLRQVLADT